MVRSRPREYRGDQSAIEKVNETILKGQANIQESNQAGIDKLRSELIEEVRVILAGKEQAAEQLKYVPANEIVRYANTVVGSSGAHIFVGEEIGCSAAWKNKLARKVSNSTGV